MSEYTDMTNEKLATEYHKAVIRAQRAHTEGRSDTEQMDALAKEIDRRGYMHGYVTRFDLGPRPISQCALFPKKEEVA